MIRAVAAVSLSFLLVACAPEPSTSALVTGQLVAAPTCPVETDPPDPQCAPRPVAGASITAERPDGAQVSAVAGEDGKFSMELGVGLWTVTFEPVSGLMGVPDPATVVVDTDAPIELGVLAYDTGIR